MEKTNNQSFSKIYFNYFMKYILQIVNLPNNLSLEQGLQRLWNTFLPLDNQNS